MANITKQRRRIDGNRCRRAFGRNATGCRRFGNGDADFGHLPLQLRRRGIRVEAAATAQTLGAGLKSAANEVIDLVPLFETFELMKVSGG